MTKVKDTIIGVLLVVCINLVKTKNETEQLILYSGRVELCSIKKTYLSFSIF